MPRPGPRPYECVRRAWHSDRHQPIRGSLIQEIFRIANEIHSPTTKKNKEWQEKLPIVVLKAEEIMYSKANSEAEYMDLKTLWDRANDAINTIIRRDESSEETGEFLQPCIEAALHLGCIPRRSSRSQRNNHPRDYLTGNMDLASPTEPNPKATSSLPPYCSKLVLGKESRNFAVPITGSSCVPNEMRFQSSQSCFPLKGSFLSKSYPVYPLYYGFCSPPIESQAKLKDPPISSKPVSKDRLETRIPPKLSLCNPDIRLNRRDPSDDPPDNNECDLSLRLGFASVGEGEDAGSKRSRQDSKQRLLPKPCENNVGSGSEILDVELTIRKRKAGEPLKDERYAWHPKLISAYSNGGARTAGL